MIKACIFDLDGVVVYTDQYHYQAWKKLANHMGYDLTPFENLMLKGLSRRDSLDTLLEMKGIRACENEKLMLSELKNKWYRRLLKDIDMSAVAKGAEDLIHDLRSAGMKTALASSSKNAGIVVKKLRLEGLFDVIVDGNMVSASKPDPEIFVKCAGMLKVDPNKCIVFEDAQSGIDAAKSAGMHTVAICEETSLKGADISVKTISNVSSNEIIKFNSNNQN
ncbi:beta-phosphoglucomutase [Peptoclostridium litorale DSM 5388]|uniref:Beta-phosphoglucomutase PgmB n=1 Tax=Peptoclostridium litorale DSM 5388 TaxID=1121324 RepID=A0A069RGS3_PEPLI|nr:beta-phosphoglucomutase [Peptoclostridium litorale]KDR96229.1 beta-phosphoglucomutase PgmB [Peptoclostridium litorale DSM 5388]SIO14050.1 beta-phosphoglucomutase [Peptoclostridium litorale DSM 5388]